jgi:hypothetical protein
MKKLRRSLQSFQSFKVLILLFAFIFLIFYFVKIEKVTKQDHELSKNSFVLQNMNYPVATSYKRKDWHDWEFIEYEKTREGPGEQGKPFELTDPDDIALNQELLKTEGLYVIASDKISVNRSVPDFRISK